MGMTIDELKCIIGEYKLRIPPTVYYELLADLEDAEFIPKTDYENRLKADMVAMLTEIQLEYSEYASVWMQWNDTMSKEKIAHEALKASKDKMIDLLQQKIDKLKGNKNG